MQVHKFHLAAAGVSGVGIVSVIATIVALAGKSSACLEQNWPASWPGASVLMGIAAVASAIGPFLAALAPALMSGGSSGGGNASPPGGGGVGPKPADASAKVTMSRVSESTKNGSPVFAFGRPVHLRLGIASVCLAILCSGCMQALPQPGQTPAQVATCTQDGNAHNWTLGAAGVLGGVGTVEGVVATQLDTQGKTDMAIASAVTAGVAGGLTLVSQYFQSAYNSDGCAPALLGKPQGRVEVRKVVIVPSFNEAAVEAQHTDVER